MNSIKYSMQYILFLFLLTDIVVLLNIPFIRPIIGFLFFTFFPGFFILQILRLNTLTILEKFVLSWGLSVSFLMIFGVAFNYFSLSIGYETPLATTPLILFFNILLITLYAIGYRFNTNSFVQLNLNLSIHEKAFLIIPILFPAMSILGVKIMNDISNNYLILTLLFLIPIYISLVCIFNSKLQSRFYPIIIFLISLSLLLLLSLRSNHIIGMDAHEEYYLYRNTLDNLHWSILGNFLIEGCLSISLLPAIYQSVLNLPSEFLFRIFAPLIYSMTPIIIYIISKRYITEINAFIASCLYMFQSNFLWTTANARANLAIFFFSLAAMVLFIDKMSLSKKKILFIIFLVSCVMSHYSSSYIIFFILLGCSVGLMVLSRKYIFDKTLGFRIVLIFFILIFLWNSLLTETAFSIGVNFLKNVIENLNNIFLAETTNPSVMVLAGQGIMNRSIAHQIEFIFTWITFILIGIGVVVSVFLCKNMTFLDLKSKKPEFLKNKFEVEYCVFALSCVVLLVSSIVLPFVSIGYGIDRQYPIALIFLCVFFVIGGHFLVKFIAFFLNLINKRFKIFKKISNPFNYTYIILLLIIIPYFFCITDVSYNIFNEPRSVILNSNINNNDRFFIYDERETAAIWLGSHFNPKRYVFTELMSANELISQGRISPARIDRTTLLWPNAMIYKDYIYIRHNSAKLLYIQPELYKKFATKNKLYSNDETEIWV